MSEEMVLMHCSPTLAGLKTGNMFTASYRDREEIKRFVSRLNRTLVPKGLRALHLRQSKRRVLIYVYRPDRLDADLSDPLASLILKELGYPCEKPERCIAQLIRKLRMESEFPHEIGLFLGYPPEDVKGFMEGSSGCCKCSGCWKVYGNAEKAQKTFAGYKKCTAVYHSQWLNGKSIDRLVVAN